MIRNFIFDWSGTLVDDLDLVLEATNHALREADQPTMTRERFRAEFRLPVQTFYDRVLPGFPAERLQRAFHERFAELHTGVTVLPHARELLEFLQAQGSRTFLLTTVPEAYLETQLADTGLRTFVEDRIAGARDKRGKIRELIQRHGLDPAETLMIGDMEHDIEAARDGGVRCCAVLTGYQTPEDLRHAAPDLLVEHLGELRRLLEEHSMELQSTRMTRRAPVATVGALIRREDGQCLLVRTRKWSDLWGIPGGKIQYGETAETALRREVLEETGLPVTDVQFVLVQDCVESSEFYRPEHFVLLNYACRTSGSAPVRLNDEAYDFRWVTEAEARTLPLNTPTRILLDATPATPPRHGPHPA